MQITLTDLPAVLDRLDQELKQDVHILNHDYNLSIRLGKDIQECGSIYKLSYRGLAQGRPTRGYQRGTRTDIANFLEVRL